MTPTTSPQRQYEEMVQKICEAVPECRDGDRCHCCGYSPCDHSTTGCPWLIGRVPNLDDVLRAIRLKRTDRAYAVDDTGLIFSAEIPSLSNRSEDAHWILGKSLSEQSDECKRFLHSLLCR